VRNAKGKLAEPLRNHTCRDARFGTVAVPQDDVTFTWVAPVADDYAGSYDAATGTTGTSATSGAAASGTAASAWVGAEVAGSSRGGRARAVRQLLRRNNAQVLLVDAFVTDDECAHMIEAATPGLVRSTVNEEGNNQAVSQYRNSQVRDPSRCSPHVCTCWASWRSCAVGLFKTPSFLGRRSALVGVQVLLLNRLFTR
jgi:hypothetical protein